MYEETIGICLYLNDIESIINNNTKQKTSGPEGSVVNFIKNLGENYTNFLQSLSEDRNRRNIS